MPSVNPASPPPTMVMGFGKDMLLSSTPKHSELTAPPGNEHVAEKARGFLGQNPSVVPGPKRRKFAPGKSGAHTGRGVMLGNCVAPHGPQQTPAPERPRGAAWLDGDKQARGLADRAKQFGQLRIGKMMKKQVCHHGFRRFR